MADSLWMRLREVSWDKYDCAPAAAKKAPKILENLSSRKEPRAMKAAHELWVALCSGGIQPAAEPSAPFMIEILGISKPAVQNEILDILLQITDASKISPDRYDRIRANIGKRLYNVQKLTKSSDDQLAERARSLLSQLG